MPLSQIELSLRCITFVSGITILVTEAQSLDVSLHLLSPTYLRASSIASISKLFPPASYWITFSVASLNSGPCYLFLKVFLETLQPSILFYVIFSIYLYISLWLVGSLLTSFAEYKYCLTITKH